MMELKKWVQKPKRAFIVGIILGTLIFGSLAVYFAPLVRGANTSIGYASPDNGATFVSVDAGDGVTITVNVTDSDSDLAQVEIWSNASGSWSALYQSGALGGVGYHNHSVVDPDALESWTTYYYNISAEDGVEWTNVTYSYTTGYVWGDMQIVWYDDLIDYERGCMYKNATGEYYISLVDGTNYESEGIISVNGQDWIESSSTTKISDLEYNKLSNPPLLAYDFFTYNDEPTFLYVKQTIPSSNWYMAHYNGASWSSSNTGIMGHYYYSAGSSSRGRYADGASVKYFDGTYQLLIGRLQGYRYTDYYLSLYSGTPYGSWSLTENLITVTDTSQGYNNMGGRSFYPSLNILDGLLVMTYRDTENDFHWETYDGATVVDKGDVSTTNIDSLSVTKDPVAGHLVAVYEYGGDLYYRILTDPEGSWSSEYTLATSPATFQNPTVSYIDDRMVVTVSNNQRGTYNIYTISAPDYRSTGSGEGWIAQYGRYEFPDVSPNDVNVNSSVVMYENTGYTSWTSVNLSTSDLGSIQCESNFRFWFSLDNISWTNVGTTNATGYINDINSTNFPALFPLVAGDEIYVKWEILDVGDVPEDLHSVDYGLRWEIEHP